MLDAADCEIQGASVPLADGAVFVDGSLHEGYGLGLDTDLQRRNWLACGGNGCEGCCRMALPSGQMWGAVFITFGPPIEPPRPALDVRTFSGLAFELRAESEGQSVQVGVKDACDPDDGTETKLAIDAIPTTWTSYEFSLDQFAGADLSALYVVLEFVFDANEGGTEPEQTTFFRNVRFVAATCGDVDGDGAITEVDAVLVLRAGVLLPGECPLNRCDRNGDGAITDVDGVNALRAAALLSHQSTCPL